MKKVFLIIFSLILWLAVFALVFEIACRIYDAGKAKKDKSTEFFISVPFLSFRITPSVVNREDQVTRYNSNSFGFRGQEFTREKQEGVYRIIAIGDSCTFGVGVSNDEHTYPVLLEKKLNREIKNRKFEVINAGIPGYLCLQSLISFLTELVDYKPDMIIVYTGWNEIGRIFTLESNMDHGYEGIFVGKNRFKYESKKQKSIYEGFDNFASVRMIKKWRYKILRWENKERLFKEEKMQDVKNDLGMEKEAFETYATKTFYIDRTEGIFQTCLDSLLSYAKSKGIEVVVLTIPQLILSDMPQDYYKKVVAKFPSLYYFALDKEISSLRNSLCIRYNEIIKKTARKNNCMLIDVASFFPRNDSNIDLYYDHVHLNDKGTALLANIIYDGVSRLVK
jgi:lysophospholipase L1-like esterase